MKCDPEQLAVYVLDELDEKQRKAIDAHLKTCGSCAQHLEKLRAVSGSLEAVPEADDEPLDRAELWEAIASQEAEPRRPARFVGQPPIRRRWVGGLALAACLAILCFRFGFALRVGDFEIAFGGREQPASDVQPAAAFDEVLVREVAADQIAKQVGPGLKELAQYVSNLEAKHRYELLALENQFARWLDLDRHELTRNIKLIANGMDELRERW